MTRTLDNILVGLNPQQKEAVMWCDGPELVLAGAGSGKTRVLVSKIAYLIAEKGVPPHRILAITFTNKAAKEMLERVKKIVGENLRGMQVSTFHSYGLHFLLRNREVLHGMGYPEPFLVADRGDCRSIMRRVLASLNLANKVKDVNEALEAVSNGKAAADPDTLQPNIGRGYTAVYERYQLELTRQGALDFDDLMILPLHLMRNDPELRERERRRLDWILVDEYQDVNTPQYLLLRSLIGRGERSLMVVGDPDQSIYGWRGADMSLILNFDRDFPNSRTVVLDENYRSTATILAAANALINNNEMRMKKDLWTNKAEAGCKIKVVKTLNDLQEAGFIADEIESLRDEGYLYSEMALLYRVNSLSRIYEQTLLERGIPHRVVRGVAFFERREVKDVLSLLRLAVNSRDVASLERAAAFMGEGLGKKSTEELSYHLARADGPPERVWRLVAASPPLRGRAGRGAAKLAALILKILACGDDTSAMIEVILGDGGYEDYLRENCEEDWEDRLDNVRELLSVLPDGSLLDVLTEISLYTDQETDVRDEPRVNLLTLHAAKGLEFPVVFLAGMEQGLFPNDRAVRESAGGLEEERRLCYVGMTRAEERLYLTSATTRVQFGAFMEKPISNFIREIGSDPVEVSDMRNSGGGYDARNRTNRRRWRW